jgi:hypothetical protein
MIVKWSEDLRPMPDKTPPGMEEAAFDPELIIERQGEVVATHRTVFGVWLFLVHCTDGKFREARADKVQVIDG